LAVLKKFLRNQPVINEVLEEELVSVDEVEGGLRPDEPEQPLLVAVPRQWVVHVHLNNKGKVERASQ